LQEVRIPLRFPEDYVDCVGLDLDVGSMERRHDCVTRRRVLEAPDLWKLEESLGLGFGLAGKPASWGSPAPNTTNGMPF
jgi:hypothetical protein